MRKKISSNIHFNSYIDGKFKNNLLTINIILPLRKDTAMIYGMLPFILTIGNKNYRNIIDLNKRLSQLYGAGLLAKVEKAGKYQILSIGINYIDKRYVLNGISIGKECCKLLFEILKVPNLIDSKFGEKEVEIVKNHLIDKLEERYDNKGILALDRFNEKMFNGEEYGVSKYGYKEDIKSINGNELGIAYKNMLNNSKIEIVYVGSGDENEIFKIVKQEFKDIHRNDKFEVKLDFRASKKKKELLDCEEKMEISQSKLLIGLKSKAEIDAKLTRRFVVMNMLFGGAPFSKLFVTVREKLNLCYNCSSIFNKYLNTITIFMGIDSNNKDKAVMEVLNQLEEVKNGKFKDEDLNNVKLLIKNKFLKLKDDIENIEKEVLSKNLLNVNETIDEEIELMCRVSREDVIKVAQLLELDTIYMLKGNDETK